MSTIQPVYKTMKELLSNRRFNIDEYQREYKWEQKHIQELLNDLTQSFGGCYKPGDDTSKVQSYDDYFLGPIIIATRDGENYIVDGQQRCTTITLLLIYLYHKCKEQNLSQKTRIEPLIFSDNYGEKSFNINVPERTAVLKDLFDGNEINVDNKEESVQNIVQRYEDIEELDLEQELGESFQHFIYWFLEKVGVIEISTTSPEQAYEMFETMNSRGKPLSPVDMLKSYLMGEIYDKDKLKIANQVWKQNVKDLIYWGDEDSRDEERDDDCIKAWLRSQYAVTVKAKKANAIDKDWDLIHSAFHKWVRDNSATIGLGNQEKNFDFMHNEFPYFANYFKLILDASEKPITGLEAVFYNARLEFTLQTTVLLAALTPTDDRETAIIKINTVATYLNIWLMRRAVNSINTKYNYSWPTMFNLCKEIRRKPIDEIVEILLAKTESDDVTFSIANADDDDWDILDNFILKRNSKKAMMQFLARVTAFVESESGRPDPFEQLVTRKGKVRYDIEHILANKFNQHKSDFDNEVEFQSWRNSVGALVLLPSDVNQSFQDKKYEAKVPHYAKQNIWAASLTEPTYSHQPQFLSFIKKYDLPFEPYKIFDTDAIVERTELLLEISNIIWAPDTIRQAAKLEN